MTNPFEGLEDIGDRSDVLHWAVKAPAELMSLLNGTIGKERTRYEMKKEAFSDLVMKRDVQLRLQWGRAMFDEVKRLES